MWEISSKKSQVFSRSTLDCVMFSVVTSGVNSLTPRSNVLRSSRRVKR